MEILRRLLTTSIGRKYIMALSGLCLGLFLVVHVIGNSSIFFGAQAFNSYAQHLHSLGPLIPVFEVGLLFIFGCHVLFGTVLFLHNRQSRPSRYSVTASAGGRTPGSRTMFYTGLTILLLILFHLSTVHFADHQQPISAIIRQEFSRAWVVIFYTLTLLGLGLHVSHGFWSLWQSFGLNHPLYNDMLRKGAWLVTAAVVGVFLVIPLLGLCWSNFLA